MTAREKWIEDMAYGYLVNGGKCLNWKSATDGERAEIQVIIERLAQHVRPPADAANVMAVGVRV